MLINVSAFKMHIFNSGINACTQFIDNCTNNSPAKDWIQLVIMFVGLVVDSDASTLQYDVGISLAVEVHRIEICRL